jgi:hypothetical protein
MYPNFPFSGYQDTDNYNSELLRLSKKLDELTTIIHKTPEPVILHITIGSAMQEYYQAFSKNVNVQYKQLYPDFISKLVGTKTQIYHLIITPDSWSSIKSYQEPQFMKLSGLNWKEIGDRHFCANNMNVLFFHTMMPHNDKKQINTKIDHLKSKLPDVDYEHFRTSDYDTEFIINFYDKLEYLFNTVNDCNGFVTCISTAVFYHKTMFSNIRGYKMFSKLKELFPDNNNKRFLGEWIYNESCYFVVPSNKYTTSIFYISKSDFLDMKINTNYSYLTFDDNTINIITDDNNMTLKTPYYKNYNDNNNVDLKSSYNKLYEEVDNSYNRYNEDNKLKYTVPYNTPQMKNMKLCTFNIPDTQIFKTIKAVDNDKNHHYQLFESNINSKNLFVLLSHVDSTYTTIELQKKCANLVMSYQDDLVENFISTQQNVINWKKTIHDKNILKKIYMNLLYYSDYSDAIYQCKKYDFDISVLEGGPLELLCLSKILNSTICVIYDNRLIVFCDKCIKSDNIIHLYYDNGYMLAKQLITNHKYKYKNIISCINDLFLMNKFTKNYYDN